MDTAPLPVVDALPGPVVDTEEAIALWHEGLERLRTADPSDQSAMERAVDALVDELRRRLGGPFTAAELTALYEEQGTDWCFETARRAAPHTPAAWDLATVANAAFGRYLRQASDYAGGRRKTGPEP